MKQDRRLARTDKAIQESLMEILTYKPLAKITIKEVAERANIERKTFYLHYDSLDEVVQIIEHQLQDELMAEINKETDLTTDKLLSILSRLMLKKSTFYEKILNTSPNLFLNDDLQLILQRCLRQCRLFQQVNPEQADYYASFVAAGIVQCYRDFLRNPDDKLETVNRTLGQIFDKLSN